MLQILTWHDYQYKIWKRRLKKAYSFSREDIFYMKIKDSFKEIYVSVELVKPLTSGVHKKLWAASLFKHVWPFSAHQALNGWNGGYVCERKRKHF